VGPVLEEHDVPLRCSRDLDHSEENQHENQRAAHGISTKLASCGGLDCARQIDTIARAGKLTTMVGCLNEPALSIAAGLALALSSPNVRYGDLDGHFDLENDPSVPGFQFEDGWLIANESPGLGCAVYL